MLILGIFIFWLIPVAVLLWIENSIRIEYRSDRIPILLYHRLISKELVEKGQVPDEEIIYASYDTVFAEQMKYLHENGYSTLDLDDYFEIRQGNMPLPEKPVIITFDDGYLSNYTMAFPVLLMFQQKATVFVVKNANEYSFKCIEGIDDFLTPDQIREMSVNGISIQSHTLTHCVLSDLDNETASYELSESICWISEVTQKTVKHIAIPRCGYNRRIKRLTKKAGYITACCNNKGSANLRTDPLALPRIVIERDMDVKSFARALMPRTSAILRIVGNIKRIPEFLGGPRFARTVRKLLYIGPLKKLFVTRNLKKAIALFALVYAIAAIFFTWQTISNWLS